MDEIETPHLCDGHEHDAADELRDPGCVSPSAASSPSGSHSGISTCMITTPARWRGYRRMTFQNPAPARP
ncbi:MAG: hypothetical protein ACJ780_13600, partial [Solirubrobacteraceae bacterium]